MCVFFEIQNQEIFTRLQNNVRLQYFGINGVCDLQELQHLA